MMTMLRFSLALTALGLAGAAQAASLTINNIASTFDAAIGGYDVSYGTDGTEISTVSWGDPVETEQSGYAVNTGVAPSQTIDNSTFQLAEFTHYNRVIYADTSITQVEFALTLDLSLDLDDGLGQRDIGTQHFDFMVSHLETQNEPTSGICDPDGSLLTDPVNLNGCADVVDISGAVGGTSFIVDGYEFTLSIIGFLDAATETLNQSFFSMENNSNTRVLIAEFSTSPVTTEVPLPASGLMLLGGIWVMGLLRRRRIY